MKCKHCNSDLERQGKLATGGTLYVCPNCKSYHEGKEEITCKDCANVYWYAPYSKWGCAFKEDDITENDTCDKAKPRPPRCARCGHLIGDSVNYEHATRPDLSPNAPIPFAFHLIYANATMAIARVFAEGAERYERDNWRLISCEEHINQAITHLFAALAGDKQDEHLEHAGARIIMAIATQKDGSLEKRPEYVSKT